MRAKQILSGAITFFAEHGFGGQTRELTAELGVSKGLPYCYFPSKEALIDRVYDEVFLRRWSPEREAALRDRSLPLIDRLKVFYIGYAEMVGIQMEPNLSVLRIGWSFHHPALY